MIEFFGIISLCLLISVVLLSICLCLLALTHFLLGVFHDN